MNNAGKEARDQRRYALQDKLGIYLWGRLVVRQLKKRVPLPVVARRFDWSVEALKGVCKRDKIPYQSPTRRVTYIYLLKCPFTGEVRYVGKSCAPRRRLRRHLGRALNPEMKVWLDFLTTKGKKPIVEIAAKVKVTNWQAAERELIKRHSKSGRLFNIQSLPPT